jgi:hypothetical protein
VGGDVGTTAEKLKDAMGLPLNVFSRSNSCCDLAPLLPGRFLCLTDIEKEYELKRFTPLLHPDRYLVVNEEYITY